MKNWNWEKIFHIAGAIGCIFGFVGMLQYGWQVWQWPVVCFFWIVVSWSKTIGYDRLNALLKEMIDANTNYSKMLQDEQAKRVKFEFELDKVKDKAKK